MTRLNPIRPPFSLRLRTALAGGILSGLAVPTVATAEDLPAEFGYVSYDAGDIVVTGQRDDYVVTDSRTATKTETPVLDTPQAITIITARQIEDQAIRAISDLARLVPGVSAGQGEGNRDQITLRGNNSTADFFVDGLRDDVQQYRSFYNLDRVEILKGSNALIFGRGGGGGVVNRVTKSPQAGQGFVDLAVSVDTFAAAYGAIDVNQALTGDIGVRLNAYYETLANHRDSFGGDRWAINPVVRVDLDAANHVTIGYEHVDDARTTDRGIPSLNGRPLPGFRNTFFGISGVNRTEFTGDAVRAQSSHVLTDTLTVTTNWLYGDYTKYYQNVFASSAVRTGGTGSVVDVQAYRESGPRQTFVGQANLIWKARFGGVDHVLLFGGEVTRQDSRSDRINGFFRGGLASANRTATVALGDPFRPPVPQFVAGPTGNGNRSTRADLDQFSLYLQDQLSITDDIQLIAGVRYDEFSLAVTDNFTRGTVARVDRVWSPRAGLVVKPSANASLYASWSRSFLPQSGDQFSTLDATRATLAPEEFTNYEIGAKWEVTRQLFLTAAAFILDRTNSRAAGPVPGTVVLTGAQRSQGFELAATGTVRPGWQVTFGYGYTDASIRSGDNAGHRVGQVPRHTLSVWNRYQATPRLGLGLGVTYQSDSFTSISNAVTLPGFARVDAALFYKLSDRIEAQVNVENILNATYFPVAHNDNNISTGAPPSARFTLKARF